MFLLLTIVNSKKMYAQSRYLSNYLVVIGPLFWNLEHARRTRTRPQVRNEQTNACQYRTME